MIPFSPFLDFIFYYLFLRARSVRFSALSSLDELEASDSVRLILLAVAMLECRSSPQVNFRAELSNHTLFNCCSTPRSHSWNTKLGHFQVSVCWAEECKLQNSKDIGQILLKYLTQSSTQKTWCSNEFHSIKRRWPWHKFSELTPTIHSDTWVSGLQDFRQQISRKQSSWGNIIYFFVLYIHIYIFSV